MEQKKLIREFLM